MDTPQRRRGSFAFGAWLRQHKTALLLAFGGVLLAVVGAQLLYPQDRGLPLARVNGKPVRWVERNALAASLQKAFDETKVTLKSDEGRQVLLPLKTLGASPNVDDMANAATAYPLGWRLVPFSIVFMRPEVAAQDVYFDEAQLKKAAADVAKKLSVPPTDARLAIEKGKLVATEAVPGAEVTAETVAKSVTTATFGFAGAELMVKSVEIPPKHTDDEIAPVRHQAEMAIGREITITGPKDTRFTPDAATIASWLVLKTNKAGRTQLAIDSERVEAYVKGLNDELKTDPGMTKVTVVDGEETARDKGEGGKEIDSGPLVAELKSAVMDDMATRNLVITMRDVPSVIVKDRRYSNSEKGLRAYVQYVTSTQDVHIALRQMDGEKWTASGRANESIPSASTYKLYVSLVLFDRINKGELHWNDKMLDTTVAGCFERMIVPSTNPCAEKWIAESGRDYINNFVHARGFSGGTTFTGHIATQTTAADLTKYLVGLYNGTLVSGEYREKLLEKMGRQLYRYGIPTGSAGWVQDKVGFLWDYVHDAAIVHHPKGAYVVTIMTRGQSYGRIAQITRELERIMYP